VATNYQRGRAFEYRTRDKLLKLGAVYVMRAAQSKGKVDLLALFPASTTWDCWNDVPDGLAPDMWLVQCKYSIHGGGRLSPGEGADLVELAAQTGGVPVFARPGKNGRGVEFINLMTKEAMVGI